MLPCQKYHCHKCCLETEMPLLKEDIARLEKMGAKDFHEPRGGYPTLKNKDGKCVFLSNGRCIIYAQKPIGCTIYPAIYDDRQNRVIMDPDCPYRDEFKLAEGHRSKLKDVIAKLKAENATAQDMKIRT